jgi:hypothetical protein
LAQGATFGLLLATSGCQRHPEGGGTSSATGSRDAAGARVASNVETSNGGSPGNNANKALAPEPPTHPLRRCFPLRPAWDDAAVADLLDRAADLFDTGDYQGALVCAEEAARQAPRSVEAHHNRAVALLHLERLDEARDAFALALALAPDDPETLEAAADLFINQLPPSADRSLLGLE